MSVSHTHELHSGWSVWRWLRLRGAGFPAADVLALAQPAAARALDDVGGARAATQQAREAAISHTADEHSRRAGDERHVLGRALKRLRAGALPDALPPGLEPILTSLRAQSAALAIAETNARGVFDAEYERVQAALRGWAANPRFREALAWQNRGVLHHALNGVSKHPPGARDKETRKREAVIARYVQRYCTKNDTIGFFGPVGWASFCETDGWYMRPGPSLLASRIVFFEHWSLDALARKLGEDPDLRWDAAPRRMPTVRVEGQTVHYPVGKSSVVPPEVAQLLSACNGERTARELVDALSAAGPFDAGGLHAILEMLLERRFITWTLEVPTGDLHPEATLRRLLERVRDEPARQRALSMLDELEARRARVASAAGNADEVDQAIESLESTFVETVGTAATRRPGDVYAGRMVVYEDCVRDLELRVGRAFLDRIGPPLALVLASARWYTSTIAHQARAALMVVHEQLRGAGTTVDYLPFWDAARAVLSMDDGVDSIVERVAAELQRRWRVVWTRGAAPTAPGGRIDCRTVDLTAAVTELFAAPGPGWPAARFHSPDLLVAARGVEAIERGDYVVVLGEMHTAINTLLTPVALRHHPAAAELLAARARDVPGACISPVESREFASRADNISLVAEDFDLEIGDTPSFRARDHVLAAAELVVESLAGELIVRTRDGRHRFDVNTFFGQALSTASVSRFRLAPKMDHHPRVTIDHLVVCRESWHFSAEQLSFAGAATNADGFAAAREWVRAHGLPRWVFAKVPEERKPIFVDFESPLYIDLLRKQVRPGSSVEVSEMLPNFDHLWLTDAEGRRYSSELRFVVVDPTRYG